jgi:hypothetical protein
MILPVGTDAPVYHRPFATIGLMAIMVLAYKLLGQVRDGSLPPDVETIRSCLARRAEALREEGDLELDEDIL